MTCIVGLIDDDEKIWLGGDSAATSGHDRYLLTEPKVFQKGPFAFGVSGSPRFQQLVQFAFEAPKHHDDELGTMEYLATLFVNDLRTCLKNGGLDRKDDGEERHNSTLLLAYRGALYTVFCDYQIGSYVDRYAAIGSGEDYARGSLYSTEGQPPHQRIETALAAAARFNNTVSPPFTIIGPLS